MPFLLSLFFHVAPHKTSAISKISTDFTELSFLNPTSHIKFCLALKEAVKIRFCKQESAQHSNFELILLHLPEK